MAGYTLVSSDSAANVSRSQTTHVEEITFDDATLPIVESAITEVRTLSAGSPATLSVSTDPQGRPVLTFTWESF
jgi:hypothetical protein